MSRLTTAAKEEKKYIETLIGRIGGAPDSGTNSTLNISKHAGQISYYERLSDENGRKIYLSADDMPRIKELAQKDYNMKILRNLISRKLAIEKLEAIYPKKSLESIYEGLSPERKALVRPLIPTDEQYLALWLSKTYAGKGFDETDESRLITDKGERVRSKSKVIIANYLFRTGIPYKYESPLEIAGKIIYPDFTILDAANRRELYLEHFGMMDDPEYSQSFVSRLSLYQEGGIFPGRRLIMTFETSQKPLDMQMVQKTIEQYLAL